MNVRLFKALIATISLFAAFSAQAVVALPYSNLVIFGDSLSDSGNNTLHPFVGSLAGQAASITNSYIPNYTYAGYATPLGGYSTYSNGDVWSTQFANMIGLSLSPSRVGGTNYATGGARTGTDIALVTNPPPPNPPYPPEYFLYPYNLPSVVSQSQQYLGANPGASTASALFVIAGGGNDARDVLQAGASPTFVSAAADQYANNIKSIVDNLNSAGAQHIIVWNTPNIGLTPAVLASNTINPLASLTGSSIANAFNNKLAQTLTGEAHVQIFDVYGFTTNVVLQALATPGGALGFTNVTQACGAPSVGDCAHSLFWDGIHPTTAADTILAQQIYALAVPEPAEMAMLMVGLLVVVGAARRRRIA